MNLAADWPLWWLDLALAAIVAEALWLAWRGRSAGMAPRDWLWCLAAGLGLLLAMRAALAGAALPLVGACLAVAGLCHWLDLRSRRRTAAAIG